MQTSSSKIVVSLIGFATIILAYILYPDFMGDDTFIHIGFIKDLASGKGFSFTGNRTYGTTSPFLVIIGAIFTYLLNSPETVIRCLSAFFSFTTIFLFYTVLAKCHFDKKIIYAAILSLALNSFFLRWALSGMEITAAMSSLLLIYYLFILSYNKYRFIAGGIIFGLAMLIRPEIIEFFIIFIMYYFFVFKNERKSLFISIIVSVVILSGWILFTYINFGTVIPNSYIYKAGENITNFKFEAATRTIKLLIAGNLPEFILLTVSIIASIIVRQWIKGTSNEKRNVFTYIKAFHIVLPIMWIAGFYGYYLLKDVVILSRYSLILVPFVILIVFTFINNFGLKAHNKIFISILIIYICSIIFGYGIMTFKVVKPASDDFVNGFQTAYREIAEIIKRDSGKRKTSVALTDVGIIGCYSGAKVYDFAGLVDANRFTYLNNYDYFIDKKPDYLILREEYVKEDIMPEGIEKEILFEKHLPGFGINHTAPRTVTLYKLKWK